MNRPAVRARIPNHRGGRLPVRHRFRRRPRSSYVCPPATFGIFNSMFVTNAGGSGSTLVTRSGNIPWAMFYSNLTDSTVLDADFGLLEKRPLDYLWLGTLANPATLGTALIPAGGSTATVDSWVAGNFWLPATGSAEESACIDYLAAGGSIVLCVHARAGVTIYDNAAESLELVPSCQAMVDDVNGFLAAIGSETVLVPWIDQPEYDDFYWTAVDGTNVYRPTLSAKYTRPFTGQAYSKVADSEQASVGTISMPFTYSEEVWRGSHLNGLFWHSPDASNVYEYGRAYQTRFLNSAEFSSPQYAATQYGPWYQFTNFSGPGNSPYGFSGDPVLFPLTVVESVGGGTVHFIRVSGLSADAGYRYAETLVDRVAASQCRTITYGRKYSQYAGPSAHNGKSFVASSETMRAHSLVSFEAISLIQTESTGDAPAAFSASAGVGGVVFHIETPDANTGDYLVIGWSEQAYTPSRPLSADPAHEFSGGGGSYSRSVTYAEADPEIAAMISAGILSAGETDYAVIPLVWENPVPASSGSKELPFDAATWDHIIAQGNIFADYFLRAWDGSSYGSITDRIEAYSVPVIWQDGKTFAWLQAPATSGQAYTGSTGPASVDVSVYYNSSILTEKFADNTAGVPVADFGLAVVPSSPSDELRCYDGSGGSFTDRLRFGQSYDGFARFDAFGYSAVTEVLLVMTPIDFTTPYGTYTVRVIVDSPFTTPADKAAISAFSVTSDSVALNFSGASSSEDLVIDITSLVVELMGGSFIPGVSDLGIVFLSGTTDSNHITYNDVRLQVTGTPA